MAECDLDYVIKAENHNADWRDRYEATLQAKDAQIIELAQAILDADYDDLQRPRELARAAIKEATCL